MPNSTKLAYQLGNCMSITSTWSHSLLQHKSLHKFHLPPEPACAWACTYTHRDKSTQTQLAFLQAHYAPFHTSSFGNILFSLPRSIPPHPSRLSSHVILTSPRSYYTVSRKYNCLLKCYQPRTLVHGQECLFIFLPLLFNGHSNV